MRRLRLISLLVFVALTSTQAKALSISGHISGGEGLALRWVFAIPTSLDTFFITFCIPFINDYEFNNMDAGGYLIFAYQDLNTSLTPDLDEPRGFYGDGTVPAVLDLQGDSGDVDIELSPPNAGGFTGHVTYEGAATGATYIMAYRAVDFGGLPSGVGFLTVNTGNGDYTAFVDSFGVYYAQAYMDVNANFLPDPGEPYDFYGNQTPATITIEPTNFPENIDFTLTVLAVDEPGDGLLPQGIALGNVYPNPFNSSTTIPFSLAAPTEIELELFDVLGRELYTLAHGLYSAGEHEIRLHGFDLATGIYYVELRAGDFSVGKRMVLIK
jgi:hypothetical protein